MARNLNVNDQITADRVRLVNQKGEVVGDCPTDEALRMAREAELDLVEVASDADPPVCRIMDYGRYKYQHQRQRHGGARRRISKLKELRLRPNTNPHDVEVRIKRARRFLERGDRVLVTMIFRGREMVHAGIAAQTLKDFAEQLQDVAKVEKEPTMEHRRMGMILVHHKT